MKAVVAAICFTLVVQSTPGVEPGQHEMIATVFNAEGRPVEGLTAKDFLLLNEDGAPQEITAFAQDSNLEVAVGIVIDARWGVIEGRGGLSEFIAEKGAARILLHLLRPGDRVSLMSMVNTLVVRQAFTTNRNQIEEALNNLQSERFGGPRLAGMVQEALAEVRKAPQAKRVLLILSDSHRSDDHDALARIVRQAEIPVYVLGLQLGFDVRSFYEAGPPNMPTPTDSAMSSESGGRAEVLQLMQESVIDRTVSFMKVLLAETRGQYTIGYLAERKATAASGIRLTTVNQGYRVRLHRVN